MDKAGMLTEESGKTSSMRVMCFLSLFAGMGAGYITLMYDTPADKGLYITSAFLIGAFAPKALQKFFERAYPPAQAE